MSGLEIEGAVVREVFDRPDSSLTFVRVGFRGTDDGEVILWVTNWEPAGRDPGDGDLTVLGFCPHGVDLDREFCSKGCRV